MFYSAYPIASLGHANWILRHYGYRATFIWGLFLYGVGALIAFPCIQARSFGGFCASIFIVGNGLGSLETAANPYITVCGPPKYAEIRINISQAFNGIGTVIAPVLGSYVFFKFSDEEALKNVQWVYVAIAVFVFILGVAFFLSTIPEITVSKPRTSPVALFRFPRPRFTGDALKCPDKLTSIRCIGCRYGLSGQRNARQCRRQTILEAIPPVSRRVCPVLLHWSSDCRSQV